MDDDIVPCDEVSIQVEDKKKLNFQHTRSINPQDQEEEGDEESCNHPPIAQQSRFDD